MEIPRFLSGQTLLALPGLGDPRFARAAIAMCSHDEGGAMGVGIGTVARGLTLHDLMRQLDIAPGQAADAPLCLGGPVEPQRGFVLHGRDWSGPDSVDVAGRYHLTGTLDVLHALAGGRGPARYVVALGYAGWGEGQLEDELTGHGWFPAPLPADRLFGVAAAERWSHAFGALGLDPAAFAMGAGRA